MNEELFNEHKARENMLIIQNVEKSYRQLQAIYSVIKKRNMNKAQATIKIREQIDTLLYKADTQGGYQHERYKGKKHDLTILLTQNYFLDQE